MTTKILTVAASEVRQGDELFSQPSRFDHSPWFRVMTCEKVKGYVVITTPYWDTWKHPMEGVSIRRLEMAQS